MSAYLGYDTDKRVIYVTKVPVDGTSVLNVQVDIYSDMKEEWRTDPLLNKLKFPLSYPVGGNVTSPGKNISPYYFLKYGWRMRPYEADHALYLENAYLLVDGGGDPWIHTLGSHMVNIRDVVPADSVTTTVVSGSGVTEQDKEDIAILSADKTWEKTLP